MAIEQENIYAQLFLVVSETQKVVVEDHDCRGDQAECMVKQMKIEGLSHAAAEQMLREGLRPLDAAVSIRR